MTRNRIYWMLPACLAGVYAAAQSTVEMPLVSAGFGFSAFHGDVGSMNHTGGNVRSAYRFGIEQRFGSWIGAELYGQYGMLSKNERSLTFNRNFESPVLFAGANALLYFDNDIFFRRNSIFAPYATAGFGWMSFDPHGDLKAANDSTYHYWSNGSIHDAAEDAPNAALSTTLQRDYVYETQLTDSANHYTRSTFAVPFGAGMRLRFGPHVGVNLQATYYLTFSDYIDNVKSGGNDSWWWYGCSVYYKFGKGDEAPGLPDDGADPAVLVKEDEDHDGVNDLNDQCPGTPGGVQVDLKGCPTDGDEDGVPDYRDKETDSQKNAAVDADGVTIDLSEETEDARKDSINAAQKNEFSSNPSQETLRKGDQDIAAKAGPDCIPAEFRKADLNKDCIITADEINRVIDNFFDGTGDPWTADSINRLIDYFFDQ